MNLKSERVILRLLESKDFEAFFKIRNSESYLKFNPMPPVEEMTASSEMQVLIKGKCTFAIINSEKQMIGMIDAFPDRLRYGVKSVCLSYNMSEDAAGKGYMREALELLIDHLLNEERYEVISARVFQCNERSRRLMESLGFQLEGTLSKAVKGNGGIIHDDYLFTLLNPNYK